MSGRRRLRVFLGGNGDEGDAESKVPVEEVMVLAGLFDSREGPDLMEKLRERWSRRLRQREETHEIERNGLERRVKDLREERRARIEQRRRLQDRLAEKEERLEELGPARRTEALGLEQKLRRLAARRTEYPVRIFERRLELVRAARSDHAEKLLADERRLLEIERELHEIAAEKRRVNEVEYARRTEMLGSVAESVRRSLDQLTTKLERLRLRGVTRTTAGFLAWAGYLSFTAFGWLLGAVVQEVYTAHSEVPRDLVAVLASSVGSAVEVLGLIPTVALLLLAPVALVFASFGLLWGSDRALGRFDPRWTGRDRSWLRGLRRRGRRGVHAPFAAPQRDLGRWDYTQLLARIPPLAIWLLLPVLLGILMAMSGGAGLGEEIGGLLLSPWYSVLFTFLGVVICVTLASFVILYVTRIIEPQPSSDPELDSAPRNREIVVLAVAFVGAAVSAVLGGVFGVDDGSFWVATFSAIGCCLVLLSSFAVAYGLLYKGLFRDSVALRKELRGIENEMEKYSGLPAIQVEDVEAERYRDDLRELDERIEEIWDEAGFWDAAELPGQILAERQDGERSSVVYRYQPSLIKGDEILEPELVAEVDETWRRVATAQEEERELRIAISKLRSRLEELEVESLDEEIIELERRLVDLQLELSRELADLELQSQGNLAQADVAFRAGSSLRNGSGSGFAPPAPEVN